MKTKLPLLICVLFLTAICVVAQESSAADSPGWKTYTVKNEEFSVALPGRPALHWSSKFLEGIQKPRKYLLLGSYADGVAYVVYMQQNPGPRLSLSDFIADQTNSDGMWDLKKDTNVSRDGFSGKAFLSIVPGDGMIQFFAGEDRLYFFLAFGASTDDERLKNFFSSVTFGKTKGIEVKEDEEVPSQPASQPSIQPQGVQPPGATEEPKEKFYTGREVDRKVRLAMKPEPRYTDQARENSLTGTVVLRCVFSSDGSIRNIRVVSGLPWGLTERAIAAARKIKFIPGVKDGKFVSMWMQLEYNFNLY